MSLNVSGSTVLKACGVGLGNRYSMGQDFLEATVKIFISVQLSHFSSLHLSGRSEITSLRASLSRVYLCFESQTFGLILTQFGPTPIYDQNELN